MHWPALPSARAALLLSLLHQFHHSQRLPPEALKARQFLQLAELLKHAFETTPFYRERLAAAGYQPGMAVGEALLARIPVLSRQDVQQAGPALHSVRMPAGHGTPHSIESAGSTGTPVRVLGTPLTQLLWEAFTLREHEWHQRDLGARLAVIRFSPELPAQGKAAPNWGPPASWLYRTGLSASLNITTPVDQQARWLLEQRPAYLLTHPTNAMALAEWFLEKSEQLPSLKQVRTISEALPADLREACKQAWGASVADVYSSRETGYLSLQCPESDLHHVQSEGKLGRFGDAAAGRRQSRQPAVGDRAPAPGGIPRERCLGSARVAEDQQNPRVTSDGSQSSGTVSSNRNCKAKSASGR